MNKKIVICISGKMRSGKDQFAEYLSKIIEEKDYGSQRMDMFAGELKLGTVEDFKILSDELKKEYKRLTGDLKLNQLTPEDIGLDWLNVSREQFYDDKTLYTRSLLQIYGTEIFCNRVDRNYWANQVFKKAEECKEDITIITDTRFPNELELMNSSDLFEVVTIRMDRNTGIINEHLSETALDDYMTWDFIVDNNGNLEQLSEAAELVADFIIEERDKGIKLNYLELSETMDIVYDPIFGTKFILT